MAEAVFLGGFATLRKPRMSLCGRVIDRVTTAMRLGSRFGREPRVVLVPRTNPGLWDKTPLALVWPESGSHAKNRPSLERVFCSNELAVYIASTVFNACAG